MSALPVPEFRPSAAEFADFDAFVKRIEPLCPGGAATVRPPPGWRPRSNTAYDDVDALLVRTPIRQEVVGSKGVFVAMHVVQPKRALAEFRKEAEAYRQRCAPPAVEFVEGKEGEEGEARSVATEESLRAMDTFFWRNVLFRKPMYGADLEGSLFEDDVCEGWNLKKLETILDHAPAVAGVHRPYLYVGMFGSLFCFHVEDADLYGINYLHTGAPKTWYTVPVEHRAKFDRLCESLYPDHFSSCHQFMRHKQMLISVDVLRKHGIPYGRVTQLPGTFTIVFPGVYHCGFNHGFNIAEAVNFATLRWLNLGKKASACHCRKDTVRLDVEAIDRAIFPGKYTAKFARKALQIERIIDKIRQGKAVAVAKTSAGAAAGAGEGKVGAKAKAKAKVRARARPKAGSSARAKAKGKGTTPAKETTDGNANANANVNADVNANTDAGANADATAIVPANLARASSVDTVASAENTLDAAALSASGGGPTAMPHVAATPTRPVVSLEPPPSTSSTVVASDSEAMAKEPRPAAMSLEKPVGQKPPAPATLDHVPPRALSSANEDATRLISSRASIATPPSSAPIGAPEGSSCLAEGAGSSSPPSGPPKRRRNWAPIPKRSMADCVVRKDLSGDALEAARLDRATMCGIEMQFLTTSTLLNTVNVVLRDVVNPRTIAALGRRMSKTRRRFLLVQTGMFDFLPPPEGEDTSPGGGGGGGVAPADASGQGSGPSASSGSGPGSGAGPSPGNSLGHVPRPSTAPVPGSGRGPGSGPGPGPGPGPSPGRSRTSVGVSKAKKSSGATPKRRQVQRPSAAWPSTRTPTLHVPAPRTQGPMGRPFGTPAVIQAPGKSSAERAEGPPFHLAHHQPPAARQLQRELAREPSPLSAHPQQMPQIPSRPSSGMNGPIMPVDSGAALMLNLAHPPPPSMLEGMDCPDDGGLGLAPPPMPIAPTPVSSQHHALGAAMYGAPHDAQFPLRPPDMLSISPPLRPPTPLELAVMQAHSKQQLSQPLLTREATAAMAMVDGWGGMVGWGDAHGGDGSVAMHGDAGLGGFGDRLLADEKL